MRSRKKLIDAAAVAVVAGAACLIAVTACAQTFPSKPIRLIVPYPPGGGTDFVARVVALKLPEVIGQNVVVDNRAGAAGLVGTELAARAPADGYTLLLVDSSLPINVSYYKNAKYDAIKDFAPITDVADTPFLLDPALWQAGSTSCFCPSRAPKRDQPRSQNPGLPELTYVKSSRSVMFRAKALFPTRFALVFGSPEANKVTS